MTLQLHPSTAEELMRLKVSLPASGCRPADRRPSIRLVSTDDAYVNEWSLVEILRRQNSGPDRAA